MACVGGRAPPGQNTPIALRRISFAWRSSRFSRSSALIRSRSSARRTRPDALVALGLPHPVAQCLRPSSRSCSQSSGSPTIATHARSGDPAPSEPRGHGPQANIVVSCFVIAPSSQELEPPVCRKSLTLRPRTVSREPPGSPCPLVGLGAVRATDRQPEQLTGDAHAYPAGQEQGS